MFALSTPPLNALAQRGDDLIDVAVVIFRRAGVELGEPVKGVFVYFFRSRTRTRRIGGGDCILR
jgi:hypothetical protein